MSDAMVKATDGGLVREEATSSLTKALEAQVIATAHARYVMAERHPRDTLDALARLKRECQRPAFAAAARYRKPVAGSAIEGPTIRFAEAAARCWRNLSEETIVVQDDETSRTIRVTVTDLEANVPKSVDISASKLVERRDARDRVVVSQRTNSTGRAVFIVQATEDELYQKLAAAASKAKRNLILSLIPADIIDECQSECMRTLQEGARRDPGEAARNVAAAFDSLNVRPADLAAYLGHPVETASPKEITDLRAIYAAIRDGETSWAEVAGRSDAAAPSAPDVTPTKAETIAARVRARTQADAPPAREPGED